MMMRSRSTDKQPGQSSALNRVSDSGSGLLVLEKPENGQDQLLIDGISVTVTRQWHIQRDCMLPGHALPEKTLKTGMLELAFHLERPIRFRIEIRIPGDCLNACMILNNQLLLDWFSEIFPSVRPEVPVSPCADHPDHVTPLRPGRLQAIDFRWQDGDRLQVCLILP